MSETPAGTIRRYLDDQGGEVEVPFHNLLTTWGEAGSSGLLMTDELWDAGVATDPPLAGLDRDDRVYLWVVDRAAEPAPESGTGVRGWAAIAAVLLLLAAGSVVSGYFVGRGSGADTDAARAEGRADGQYSGARRGSKLGYRQAYKEARKVGYRQTYAKAYARAKKKALQKPATEVIGR